MWQLGGYPAYEKKHETNLGAIQPMKKNLGAIQPIDAKKTGDYPTHRCQKNLEAIQPIDAKKWLASVVAAGGSSWCGEPVKSSCEKDNGIDGK